MMMAEPWPHLLCLGAVSDIRWPAIQRRRSKDETQTRRSRHLDGTGLRRRWFRDRRHDPQVIEPASSPDQVKAVLDVSPRRDEDKVTSALKSFGDIGKGERPRTIKAREPPHVEHDVAALV